MISRIRIWFHWLFGWLYFLLLVAFCSSGCSAASPTCKVIDALHDGCVLLQYTSPSGSTEQVPVSAEDLNGLGTRVMLRRQAYAVTDAGAD